MKKLLTYLALIFIIPVFAQNTTVLEPRLRMNRSASLVLSTTWQTVDFNGTSTYNVNTFGKDPVSTNSLIWWDSTNKLFRFYNQYAKNYVVTFYVTTTATVLSTRATIQYRIVIPNGISVGVDLYTPFPDTQAQAYSDIGDVTILSSMQHKAENIGIYADNLLKTNGCYIQVRLSNLVPLGTVTLNNAIILIQ